MKKLLSCSSKKMATFRNKLTKCAIAAAALALTLAMGLPAQALGDDKIQVINQKSTSSYTSINGVEVNVFNYDASANKTGLGLYGYKFFHSESYGGAGVPTAEDGVAGSGSYNIPSISPLLGADGYPVVSDIHIPYIVDGKRQSIDDNGTTQPIYVGLNQSDEQVLYILEDNGQKTVCTSNNGTYEKGTKGSGDSLKTPSADDRSMKYLFDNSSSGVYHKGTMTDGGGLFQKDANGYYYYDSAKNAAAYNQSLNFFELYNAIIRPWYTTNSKTNGPLLQAEWSNFLPFDQLSDAVVEFDGQGSDDLATNSDGINNAVFMPSGVGSETPYSARLAQNNLVDLWFGMTVDFEFYMPSNGQLPDGPDEGKDPENMVFRFHGDDDVFLYINGVLVLDIGGTHAAEDGWIDFHTGVVFDPTCITSSVSEEVSAASLTSEQNSQINEEGEYVKSYYTDADGVPDYWVGLPKELVTVNEAKKVDNNIVYAVKVHTCTYKTLRSIFENAKGDDFDESHFKENTFANYTEHTLKFFYMERGGNISYCRLQYNMPVLSGELNVAKHVDDQAITDSNAEYHFVLLECDGATDGHQQETAEAIKAGDKFVSDIQYVIVGADGEVSAPMNLENGEFSLKANEVASFLFDTTLNGDDWMKKHYCVKELGDASGSSKATECITIPIGSDEDHHKVQASEDPYITVPFVLAPNETVDVEFENTLVEDLRISKIETGDSAPGSLWEFEVTLSGDALLAYLDNIGAAKPESFTLQHSINGASFAPMTFIKSTISDEYVGQVSVPANGHVIIEDVPARADYKVAETHAITDDSGQYKTSSDGATGTIVSGVDSEASFTNAFVDPASVAFEAEKALKIYGQDTKVGNSGLSFEFVLTPKNGAKMPGNASEIRVSCDADGNIDFGSIEYGYSDVGSHTYTIYEIAGTNSFVTYDGSQYEITVTVTRSGTDLSASITGITRDGATHNGVIAFANEYNPPILPSNPKVSANITATKTLDGKAPGGEVFSFQLKDDKGNVVATASNNASGSISFGNITFDAPGTYEYTISEVAGANEGFEYDGSVFGATVTVTEDASGKLSASVAYSSTPVFANKTKYEPVDVAFGAVKTLDGEQPGSNAFLFVLEKDGVVVEKATNSASGTVAFGTQTFDTEGVYEFTLSEVVGSDEGFEYDGSTYKIIVTVTKGEGSKLVAATSVTKDGAAYDGVIAFANKTVEEEPDAEDPVLPDTGGDPKPDGPLAETGDKSGLWILVGLTCMSATALLFALRMMKRRA